MASKTASRLLDELNEEKTRRESVIRSYKESIRDYLSFVDEANDYVSLTEIAKQYSDDSPGYVIQSWMRSRNTIDFLRQWEIAENPVFDNNVCDELIT